jgi:hypothetical protein
MTPNDDDRIPSRDVDSNLERLLEKVATICHRLTVVARHSVSDAEAALRDSERALGLVRAARRDAKLRQPGVNR